MTSARPTAFCAPSKRPWILTAAILTSALGFIDGSVVSIAIPAMRRSLDASLVEAQWISNAYMLTLSSLILVGGAAGDRFGIARILGIGLWIFMSASILSAIAPSADFLIAARALKGVGAALMVPGSLALIARAYPAKERGRAIGYWAAASAVTTAIGPVLGGALLSIGNDEIWRAIFAINLPLGLLVIWILKSHVGRDPALAEARVDWIGASLVTLALGSLAWSLSSLGSSSAVSPGLLAMLGIMLLLAFLSWQMRAEAPMVPLSLFLNRTFSAANIVTFALYFALSAVLFYQPMTVISAWGVSEVSASIAFVPLSVFIGLLSGWVGRLADRIGPGPLITMGAAIVAVAFAGLAVTAPLREFWTLVLPLNSLMGFGMALVVGPLSTAVMASVPDEKTGTASGINNAVSRTAGLVAVAAMGSLAAIIYASAGGGASFGGDGSNAAHRTATDAAFAAVAWTTAALAALSSITAWFGIARQRG